LVTALALVAGVVGAQGQGDGGRGGGRGRGGGFGDERGMGRDRGDLGRGALGLIQIVVEQTGLTVREIGEQVRGGFTLAEIITANGGSVEEVTNAAIAQAAERINEAVANGRITQERADEMIAALADNVSNMLNFDAVARGQQRMIVQRVAGETGLSGREALSQWQAGGTLADILTANGEDVQAFIDETLTRTETRLSEAVTNGRLTQEQADQRLVDLRTLLPELLNQTFPADADVDAEADLLDVEGETL
jgi:hypothetical protein